MSTILVTIDINVPAAYYENWWVSVGVRPATGERMLESGRRGTDAEYDLDVLTGRLASGLYRMPVRVDDYSPLFDDERPYDEVMGGDSPC